MNNGPSTNEILRNLLVFFSATADDHLLRLGEYKMHAPDIGSRSAFDDPLVQLAEGLEQYASACVTDKDLPNSFFVGGLSIEAVALMHELSTLIQLILSGKDANFLFSDNGLKNAPVWNLVRRISKNALSNFSENASGSMDLHELLCYVAD